MTHFTAEQLLLKYIATAAQDCDLIVFLHSKQVWAIRVENMLELGRIVGHCPCVIAEREDDNGDSYKTLRLCLDAWDRAKLHAHGALKLGDVKDFFGSRDPNAENIGEFVERKVAERYHATLARKSAAYYTDGDMTIGGMKVQVKYQTGTIAKVSTINRAYRDKVKKG